MNERRQDSRRKIHRRGKRHGARARCRHGDRRRRHRQHQAQPVAEMMVVRREFAFARSLRSRLLPTRRLTVLIVRPGEAAKHDQRAAVGRELQVARSPGNGQHRCDARLRDEHQAQQQPKIPSRRLHSARASRARRHVAIAESRKADHRQTRPRADVASECHRSNGRCRLSTFEEFPPIVFAVQCVHARRGISGCRPQRRSSARVPPDGPPALRCTPTVGRGRTLTWTKQVSDLDIERSDHARRPPRPGPGVHPAARRRGPNRRRRHDGSARRRGAA